MLLLNKLEVKKLIGDEEIKYVYKLTQTELNQRPAYGITIEKVSMNGEEAIDIYKESIDIISPIRHKVEQLLNVLYKAEVSPVHLVDIIGEYVDECAVDFDGIEDATRNVI